VSSAESVRPQQPEDEGPALPREDIRLSIDDRLALQRELASVYNTQRAVERLLRATTFPRGNIPAMAGGDAEEVWEEVLLQASQGRMQAGHYQILRAALRPFPHNEVFRGLAESYLPTAAARRPRAAEQPQPPEAAEPPVCHVIIRASTEEIREQAAQALRELGLDPVEQWSTAHAVSYRVNSGHTEQVRTLMQGTDFGWTVVAPDMPDYLLARVYVEGPDGRQFRITDAPAQQTVGNLTAEVVEQYGADFPDAGLPAVADQVGPDGQGRRLDPNETLHEAGVRDGDRMRVGFQARAAAVNPVDRQDALYRVLNQIRDFADSRDPGQEFVVRANSALMPTEYELEFHQPSFGPPPSADSAPVDIELHRVLIQLGSGFPEEPPMVFWLTPIYHPNVFPTYDCDLSRKNKIQMGLVCLGALQQSYLPSLNFGALCQLLMDIAGFRNYSLFKSDGTIDASGAQRRRVDFFDPYAAEWVASGAGQRRIRAIKGSPIGDVPRTRPEYRNVIERIGGE